MTSGGLLAVIGKLKVFSENETGDQNHASNFANQKTQLLEQPDEGFAVAGSLALGGQPLAEVDLQRGHSAKGARVQNTGGVHPLDE